MKQILLVDNYDSFTFNLFHSLEKNEDTSVTVVRNDKLLALDVKPFSKIVLSPGPGLPSEAGQLMKFIEKHYQQKSILGICLGHQALGQFFGAEMKNLTEVMHGVQLETEIVCSKGIFNMFPKKILTGHYHSWVINDINFPSCLKISAINKEGGIMAFKHCEYDLTGIQFHPESILTPLGDSILSNWLNNY